MKLEERTPARLDLVPAVLLEDSKRRIRLANGIDYISFHVLVYLLTRETTGFQNVRHVMW